MPKPEQIARLALARATKRCTLVVIATDNQRKTVELMWSIEPRAVISLIGTDGVRVHGTIWGSSANARAVNHAA